MAVITLYQNGMRAGVAPQINDHERAKRQACMGWSARSTRSNLDFLRSVVLPALSGLGHAFTLTVGRCPESPDAWSRLRNHFLISLRRAGALRIHWVTEWQRRGVPHLHGVVYFDTPVSDRAYALQRRAISATWMALAREFDVRGHSQHINPIDDALGWLQYLAKHAARGADHYQRSQESIPLQWQGVTGRVWGKVGQWPCDEALKLQLSQRGFWELRRRVRSWRVADARASTSAYRIVTARKMLKSNLEALSAVRGVSEWIPQELMLSMVAWVASLGHTVVA